MTYFSSNLLSRFLIASMAILLCATHSFAQLRHPPEAVDAYQQGLAELEQENYDAAIRLFDSATSLDDTYAEAYSARGDALKALKDYSTALKSYKHGLDIDVSLVSAYNGRGRMLPRVGANRCGLQ